MKPDRLIIFYRNPELGKVKTRLAATVGDERALAIYFKLVSHTREISAQVLCDKVVYYSDFVDTEDSWSNKEFEKCLQEGHTLGERMKRAMGDSFGMGYKRICIIGTDCWELTSALLNEAFNFLRRRDAVIGPAYDGGYYLIGMNRFMPDLFLNKKWSTDTVLNDTLKDLIKLQCNYELLSPLHDVDYESDLPPPLN